MSGPTISTEIDSRFNEVATAVCQEAKLDSSDRLSTVTELRNQLTQNWVFARKELGMDPHSAERYALKLFDSGSAIKYFKKPADVRLLFADRRRPMRYVLIIVALLMWMTAHSRYDGFKNGREIGWVPWLTDFGRHVVIMISVFIGGLCALARIFVFLGLRQNALALYERGRKWVPRHGVTQVALPMVLVSFVILHFGQNSGFPGAGDADRIVVAGSSGSHDLAVSRLEQEGRTANDEPPAPTVRSLPKYEPPPPSASTELALANEKPTPSPAPGVPMLTKDEPPPSSAPTGLSLASDKSTASTGVSLAKEEPSAPTVRSLPNDETTSSTVPSLANEERVRPLPPRGLRVIAEDGTVLAVSEEERPASRPANTGPNPASERLTPPAPPTGLRVIIGDEEESPPSRPANTGPNPSSERRTRLLSPKMLAVD